MQSILLGLIGDDLSLSRTPAMHEAEGLAHGRPTVYRRLDTLLTDRSLPELIDATRILNFDGLNITHLFKQEVLDLLDAIAPAARALGAVNTVVISPEGKLSGHNTDVTGFARALREGLPGAALSTVVQLGAGGAGAAVAHALAGHGVGTLRLVDLDPAKARELAESVNAAVGRAVAEVATAEAVAGADGIVNATPMGMLAHPGTAFDTSVLRAEQWVAEVVYMPLETQLLADARAAGCRVLDGSRMAVYQAVDAFGLFTGLEPDAGRMRETFLSLG